LERCLKVLIFVLDKKRGTLVTIESLYEVMYEKSIGTKMNDLDLCLEVISRSRQPLRYIWRWISRKPFERDAWFRWTANRKWHMGYRMVTWPMTSRDLALKGQTRVLNTVRPIISKLLHLESSNFDSQLWWMPSGHTNNFPESGNGLGHVTPTIFGSPVGCPSDSLSSCFSSHLLLFSKFLHYCVSLMLS